MYGIFTYIWAIFGVNVGKYSIHGASGDDMGRSQANRKYKLKRALPAGYDGCRVCA